MEKLRVAGKIVLWLVSIALALVMLGVGFGKLTGASPWPAFFEQYGYPQWFRLLVGALQMGGGVALLVPRVAAYGAGVLAVVMAGASFTELTAEGGFPSPAPAIAYTVLLTIVAVVRWRQARHSGAG